MSSASTKSQTNRFQSLFSSLRCGNSRVWTLSGWRCQRLKPSIRIRVYWTENMITSRDIAGLRTEGTHGGL